MGAIGTFLSKILDIIILSIVWLISCVLVVTIVPATSSLYYVVNKVIRYSRGYALKEYFLSLKDNFKNAFLCGVPLIFAGAVLALITIILYINNISAVILFAVADMVYIGYLLWVCACIARFDNNISNTLKNSFVMCIYHFLTTVVVLVLLAAGIYLIYIWLPAILFVPGLFMLFTSILMEKQLRKHMTEEDIENEDALNRINI